MRSPTQRKTTPTSSFTPLQSGLLQRKCASCGQHTIAGGECAECQKKQSTLSRPASLTPLQRRAANQSEPSEVPPIVNEVLRSPGQPLERDTRTFMESRFGHDFSRVQVHTDAKAAESARTVNALAYTVGRDVVFGTGQYTPGTTAGRSLLAHELTHVVQQGGTKRATTGEFRIGQPNQVHKYAAHKTAKAVMFGQAVPQVSSPTSNLPNVLQRQTRTPEEAVKAVRSLHVEENLEKAVTGAEGTLKRKLKAREDAIRKFLEQVEGEPGADAQKRTKALQNDLSKDLNQILTSPDSRYVTKSLRDDILKEYQLLESKRRLKAEGEKKWHQYDNVFASTDVVKTLSQKGFSPADLKALVAQESYDLTVNEQEGDIAGIAQMGTAVVKEVGGEPADRLLPKKAIPLAAKVLIKKAEQLEKLLQDIPSSDDYKKFVFASYNAGATTIAIAQKKAKIMKRSPTSWDQLIEGKEKSPLYAGIKEALPKIDPDKKYRETTDYVLRIFARLS